MTVSGITSRGYRYPGDASAADVPADLKKLADDVNGDIVSILAGTSPFSFLQIDGSGGGSLSLRDTTAGADLKRSRMYTVNGHTLLQSLDDAYTTSLFTGFDFNHADGSLGLPTKTVIDSKTVRGSFKGRVTAAGVAVSGSGTGWSVTRPATGIYEITFTGSPFSAIPVLTPVPEGSGGLSGAAYATVEPISANVLRVHIETPQWATGTPNGGYLGVHQNTPFNFRAE